ncbi:MAG TPA: hypothetical protein VNC50_17225 [Planctomycetia bacterium]|nr:hypothetical protein [Planctomycetia bacterium]
MLANESLWQVAARVHAALAGSGVDHAIAGGVAVFLHGYRRFTADLDLLVRREDSEPLFAAMAAAGFEWKAERKEFDSPEAIPVQLLIAGEKQGRDQETTFPSPSDASAVTTIEGLPVLSLAQLIQSKLACGLGDPRRMHKDFADVVELIAAHRLDGSFAGKLHKSLRKEFRELAKRAAGG